jgi:hypothetical protein
MASLQLERREAARSVCISACFTRVSDRLDIRGTGMSTMTRVIHKGKHLSTRQGCEERNTWHNLKCMKEEK